VVRFSDRHIGPRSAEIDTMLARLGYASLEELMTAAIPPAIRSASLKLPAAVSEAEVAAELRALAAANNPGESMIGLGYAPTITPAVIRRNRASTVEALQQSGVDKYDIPAFLRKQAD